MAARLLIGIEQRMYIVLTPEAHGVIDVGGERDWKRYSVMYDVTSLPHNHPHYAYTLT